MLYGVFFTLVVPIYNRLKEAMRPVIFEPTASALSVAFVDYIIFGVYFRQLVSAATIIASANAVVFYFISHNYIFSILPERKESLESVYSFGSSLATRQAPDLSQAAIRSGNILR